MAYYAQGGPFEDFTGGEAYYNCAWAVDQSLNLDRSIDRSKAYVNLRYSGPLMIRSIAENCTACSNFQDQGEF